MVAAATIHDDSLSVTHADLDAYINPGAHKP